MCLVQRADGQQDRLVGQLGVVAVDARDVDPARHHPIGRHIIGWTISRAWTRRSGTVVVRWSVGPWRIRTERP